MNLSHRHTAIIITYHYKLPLQLSVASCSNLGFSVEEYKMNIHRHFFPSLFFCYLNIFHNYVEQFALVHSSFSDLRLENVKRHEGRNNVFGCDKSKKFGFEGIIYTTKNIFFESSGIRGKDLFSKIPSSKCLFNHEYTHLNKKRGK